MPAADTVLLPLCVAISLLGILLVAVSWRRGRKGRLIQSLGIVLVPVALYFTGLLRLVWNAVVALVGWAARIVFSPAVWFGLSLLGVCVLLWIVGGIVARRNPSEKQLAKQARLQARKSGGSQGQLGAAGQSGSGAAGPAAAGSAGGSAGNAGRRSAAAAKNDVDPELAEIEALLKSRGIN